jgi:hypothetical protein
MGGLGPTHTAQGSDACEVRQSDATDCQRAGTLRDLRFVLAVAIRDLDLVDADG